MSTQISNSYNSIKLNQSNKEQITSRVVKSLPSQRQGESIFLCSGSTKNNIYLYLIEYKDESNEWLDLLKLLLRWFCYCYLGFEGLLVIIITNNLFEFVSEYFS